jgi:peroxiredoxin Q/BCP
MQKVEAGSRAPAFDLPTDGGGRVKLSGLAGKKVVLYFYPADDTSGCTLEAIDFSKFVPKFEATNAVVVGVSPDSAKSHDSFKAKHKLTFMLAADVDRDVIGRYGLWVEKNNFGKKYMGVERATFLIDEAGKIARAWHKVQVKGHVEEVLAAAKSL